MPWTTQSTRTAKKKRSEAYAVYSKKSEVLIEQFMIDRKKAKIVFLSNEIEQSKLEKGISQNATDTKNRAINTLSKWMTQFLSISRNAFKEEPQMMEAFGFIVKN
ncbi:MAG: hypothetical protein WD577_14185 [Bacteroidales bacterium]